MNHSESWEAVFWRRPHCNYWMNQQLQSRWLENPIPTACRRCPRYTAASSPALTLMWITSRKGECYSQSRKKFSLYIDQLSVFWVNTVCPVDKLTKMSRLPTGCSDVQSEISASNVHLHSSSVFFFFSISVCTVKIHTHIGLWKYIFVWAQLRMSLIEMYNMYITCHSELMEFLLLCQGLIAKSIQLTARGENVGFASCGCGRFCA